MEHVRRSLKFRDISANRILLFLFPPISFQWCDEIERNKSRMFRSIQVESINRLILSFNRILNSRLIYENRLRNPYKKNYRYINHRSKRSYDFTFSIVFQRVKSQVTTNFSTCVAKRYSFDRVYIYIYIYMDVGGRALCLGEMRANK